MSFTGQNPRFRSTILTDIGLASIANPAAGTHRLINRGGTFQVQDSTGLETAIGAGGTVDRITQVGHGFDEGEVLYYTGSAYARALANASNTAEIVGMVSRVIDVDTFELTLEGKVTGLTGLTAGEVYFLSSTVSGAITTTEPTVLGHVSLPIGIAISATAFYVKSSRGAVVGSTNARTEIALFNNTTTNVQDASAYQAGELAGYVEIDGTTDLKFYVSAPFARNGAGTDYNISPQYVGDTPPVDFDLIITTAGIIRVTLPNIAGFVSAKINYGLNVPAVGATFPLAIDSTLVQFSTLKAKDSGGFVFQENGGTQIGSISDTGVWTFNGSSVNSLVATGGGTVSSRLKLDRGSDDNNQYMEVGWSTITTVRANIPLASSQTQLDFQQRGSDGTRIVGGYNSNGAWTLGPAGSFATSAHTFNGGLTVNGDGATLTLNKSGNPAALQYQASGSNIAQIGGKPGGGLQFYQDSTTEVGSYNSTGAWTFGSSTPTQNHRSNGNFHIYSTVDGTTDGSTGLRIQDISSNYANINAGGGPALYFEIQNNGNVASLSSAGAWTNASDLSLKKEIRDVRYGLETVLALKPKSYKMKADDSEQIGFIAQDMELIIPEVVTGQEIKGIAYGQLTAVLVKAIQELSARLVALENKGV